MKQLWITGFFVVALGLTLNTSVSVAATLNIDLSGQLMGATNVEINGNLFDVMFKGGTCASIFGGCNESNDFQFHTQEDAAAAAQSLLDQVFLDTPLGAFDTKPELTNGIKNPGFAIILTPYANPTLNQVHTFASENCLELLDYGNRFVTISPNYDTTYSNNTFLAFAVWSPAVTVPEPSTMLLLGTGLLGIVGARFRKKKK